MAGMATAARLQAAGLSTVVVEAHWQPGGCAGFYRRRGFSFDIGATTLVDFGPGGVGGELLDSVGLRAGMVGGPVDWPAPPSGSGLAAGSGSAQLELEMLPGYVAWLPDRRVTLFRDAPAWHAQRLQALGHTPAHRRFWSFLDELSETFWAASRSGIRIPPRGPRDLLANARAVGARRLPLGRYLFATLGDVLRRFGLRDDVALVGLLSMVVEDTVHSTVDRAPAINAALGVTIRGSGLARPRGGARGFWRAFTEHYRALGGTLVLNCPARRIERADTAGGGRDRSAVRGRRHGRPRMRVVTDHGEIRADQVVSALPAALTAAIGPPAVATALTPYLERDRNDQGGAVVVVLGVPEEEVTTRPGVPDVDGFTHHQLLQSYGTPLGNGNNMFVSVSSPGDTASAPPGHRAVMISTHCELADWTGLTDDEYAARKEDVADRLIGYARRVYPELGARAVVREVATPRTYQRFARRPGGAVGGVRLSPANANLRAVPHDIGVAGIRIVGDTTWPGVGTVACALGSRIVAGDLLAEARTFAGRSTATP